MEAEIDRRSQEEFEQTLVAYNGKATPADDTTWDDSSTNEVFAAGSANSAATQPPLPEPRWLIAPFLSLFNGLGCEFYIQILVPTSVATHVRVEDPEHRTVFHDAAYWEDVPTDGVGRQFRASGGGPFGVPQQLDVSWIDAAGTGHTTSVPLQRHFDDDYTPF